MNFKGFLKQLGSAHAVSIALENGKKPSKKHLQDLGIDEVYKERMNRAL